MFRVIVFTLLLVLSTQAETITRTKVLMGTFATITLERSQKHLFKNAFATLVRVENALSSYKKESPIYKLNRNKKAQINLYTYEALRLSQIYYEQTDAYFNVAIGSITKDLYRFGEDERVPSLLEIKKSNTSLSSLLFDERQASIDTSIKIDLGGMGKGFGVDIVAEYLRINAAKDARVALSGDIRCLGICLVEVVNPFSEEPLVRFKTIQKDMGISTSGNYNRFVKDRQHNHLINPKTKISQKEFISITLISTLPNSDLDAYATAASVMPKEQAYSFLQSLKLGYIILQKDATLHISENIELYTVDLSY